MVVRGSKADEDRPPVVDLGGHARGDLAGVEIGGGEATPSPLVLEFVENVFGVGAITIELRDDGDGFAATGDQDLILEVLVDQLFSDLIDDLLFWLGRCLDVRAPRITLPPWTAQHDDAPLRSPHRQAQGGFDAVPPVAGINPALAKVSVCTKSLVFFVIRCLNR